MLFSVNWVQWCGQIQGQDQFLFCVPMHLLGGCGDLWLVIRLLVQVGVGWQ